MHTDVTTNYLGLELRSPLIIGACPLTLRPETVRELTIAGAGAVVLPSLLEEQVVRRMISRSNGASSDERRLEAAGKASIEESYNGGVENYLRTISLLKHQTGIPIIANLNGCTGGNWLQIASEIQRSGADAIELSFHNDMADPSMSADLVELNLLEAVECVSDLVSIPVSVKLLPFFTSLPNLAWRLAEVGASGIVIFGREPSWEVRDSEVVPTSFWPLTGTGQLQTTLSGLIRLRSGGPALSIAASGGIASAKDVVDVIVAGADVAMITSELYRTGPDGIAHVVEGIAAYLQRKGFESFHSFLENRATAIKNRQSQIEPMIRGGDYRDDHPRAPQQASGDRWGHRLADG